MAGTRCRDISWLRSVSEWLPVRSTMVHTDESLNISTSLKGSRHGVVERETCEWRGSSVDVPVRISQMTRRGRQR